MDIEGTYTLQAQMKEIWQCLMDQQTLQHAIPGLERLESTGQHTYAFTLRIKQAPLRGVYQGQVMVDNLRYPTSYRLSLEGDGQHNTLQGIWDICLSPQHDNTVVAYTGTLNPGKMSALLPPTLVKGTLKILIQQFFTSLAEQLRTTTGAIYPSATLDESEARAGYDDDGNGQGGRNESGSYNGRSGDEASLPTQTILHTLVRLIGLGNHDSVLENLWVARLKRIGAFSVLVLLVWIGTRLPRRLFPHD
jgi:uncharacterized protein